MGSTAALFPASVSAPVHSQAPTCLGPQLQAATTAASVPVQPPQSGCGVQVVRVSTAALSPASVSAPVHSQAPTCLGPQLQAATTAASVPVPPPQSACGVQVVRSSTAALSPASVSAPVQA